MSVHLWESSSFRAGRMSKLGYAVIPSSTKLENLASNLLAQELRLDQEDMAKIALLERNAREVSPEGLAPAWD